MYNNQLNSIGFGTFQGLSNLQVINLNNNQLCSIDAYEFKGLTSLTRLDLRYNKIIKFDQNSLVGLNKLESVCLYDNPISTQFPTSINDICATNIKCRVILSRICF